MSQQHPYDEPNTEEINENQQSQQEQQEEDKPIVLSKIKTGLIFIAFLLIIAIIIMTFKSCSLSRKVNSSQKVQNEQVATDSDKNSITSTGEEDTKKLENTSGQEVSGSVGVDNSNAENILDNNENTEIEGDNTQSSSSTESTIDINDGDIILKEVSEPQLSKNLQSTAVVSSKSMYISNTNSYVYQVSFLLLLDDDDYQTVSYYCPKTTYDALIKGDSVNIEYQLDSTGIISISSVSR